MKLPVEWITERVPVTADAEEIADRLTMAGFEVEGKGDSARGPVLDIKVTPNRGDGLSVVGVARELSAAYRVRMAEPPPSPLLRKEGGQAAAPSTQHSALSTQHSALSTQHSAHSTQHSAPSTQHSALSTQHPALSTQHSALPSSPSKCPTYARDMRRGSFGM
jgi:hypothetical protein